MNKPGPTPDVKDSKRLEQSIITLNNVLRKEQRYIMDKYKISSQEMEILQYVIENGPQKMKVISEHFNIKLSSLTSVIDKAEKRRVVKRVNSKEDRRVVYLDEETFIHFVNGMETFTRLSSS